MLYLTEDEVRQLLPMHEAVRLMRLTFEALAGFAAQNQPRRRMILPTGSVLHSMAGAYGGYFGTKFYSTNPKHGAHFLFALYEADTGLPLALMEANHMGQIRTGAASGYATDLMAAPDAAFLGVIGSGFQAQTQIAAIRAVRDIREVRVWSRDRAKRERFAEANGAVAVDTAREAVQGVHIVATATFAKDPVLEDAWILPGTHVNAVGSNVANRAELPAALMHRASVVAVDSLNQACLEAGDIVLADSWDNVVELQDVSKNHDPAAVTVFKSTGLGVEDVAVGGYIYEQAIASGVGRPVHS